VPRVRSKAGDVMRRVLLGRERTAARKALASLSALYPSARQLARVLGMKRHSIAPLLDGRARPQRAFLDAASRLAL